MKEEHFENTETEHVLKLRNLTIDDYQDLTEIIQRVYSHLHETWEYQHIKKLVTIFPEGQICVEDKGKVVAFVLSLIVDYAKFGDEHTYQEITGNFKFHTHAPKGDVLYGIEVAVHPDYQGMRLGRRLYDARKELCELLNLRAIVAGGRMPNYKYHSDKLSPREYIEKVRHKEIYDPVLTFQLSNDFQVKKFLTNYMPRDVESKAYATLLQWHNIYYQESRKVIDNKKIVIRLGVVQWQMRNLSHLESLLENVEFFVDSVSSYKADFVVFPEFFNVPLMAEFNEMDTAEAIRKLANYTDKIRETFIDYALGYNINIIAGSMPLYKNEQLFNVAFLCRRDGTWDFQYKIHITPAEITDWGMQGGDIIKVFETDVARIGILVCYDVEFPELSRIMAEKGMQILFIPFSTDTQNGYQRVRICAQARAIENECYVAIAGSVGNLPKVKNMDIQYAQSAVFSPSDFAFPNNAIIAESTANTEMAIIADIDLDLLKELHTLGSVRNLKDRRTDLYEVIWKEC
jgi:predicted amidohydrolase/ribosomal protein S18 acetylase RimI-like enzyme